MDKGNFYLSWRMLPFTCKMPFFMSIDAFENEVLTANQITYIHFTFDACLSFM